MDCNPGNPPSLKKNRQFALITRVAEKKDVCHYNTHELITPDGASTDR